MVSAALRDRLLLVVSTSALAFAGAGAAVGGGGCGSTVPPAAPAPAAADTTTEPAHPSAEVASAPPERAPATPVDEPPPMSVEEPTTPEEPAGHAEKRCFTPRTDTSGAMVRVDLSTLPFDRNGCLPAERTGGSCVGYRATSGPTFRGGKCCYEGRSFQPAPCGRPLFLAGEMRIAPLVGAGPDADLAEHRPGVAPGWV
jgi:hypothetical protein